MCVCVCVCHIKVYIITKMNNINEARWVNQDVIISMTVQECFKEKANIKTLLKDAFQKPAKI